MHTYTQFEKRRIRRIAIENAVDILTYRREEACCVPRDYVRRVYDYFTMTVDLLIDEKWIDYFANWRCRGTITSKAER